MVGGFNEKYMWKILWNWFSHFPKVDPKVKIFDISSDFYPFKSTKRFFLFKVIESTLGYGSWLIIRSGWLTRSAKFCWRKIADRSNYERPSSFKCWDADFLFTYHPHSVCNCNNLVVYLNGSNWTFTLNRWNRPVEPPLPSTFQMNSS